MVRSEGLRYFKELVEASGHASEELLRSARIDSADICEKNRLIPYKQMVALLENTSEVLECPDFGLRLAERQYADGILGPLDIAMRNSPTVGEAWQYCAEHVHLYSTGASVTLTICPDTGREMMRFEILLDRVYHQRQAVEHALLVSQLATKMFSGGRAAAREVWFTHEPVGEFDRHQTYFGCPVRFAQPCNAMFFDKSDFAVSVAGQDERVLEMATYFIDMQFPAAEAMITSKVRIAIEQKLSGGNCTQADVASALGMHPRTLQRRLKDENVNFEAIKDDVRRDAAVRYLRQTNLPLKTITGLLGYSELSVFYRSCHRWFAMSPNAIREAEETALFDNPGDVEMMYLAV
jgi:AraC-like DNA-binding protein